MTEAPAAKTIRNSKPGEALAKAQQADKYQRAMDLLKRLEDAEHGKRWIQRKQELMNQTRGVREEAIEKGQYDKAVKMYQEIHEQVDKEVGPLRGLD